MRSYSEPRVLTTILLLTPMVMGLPLAMDVYIPALPHMLNVFHATTGTMQLTLTLFMLTAGLMQLIIGPLSDQYGRKPISLFIIFLFALGSLLCANADTVYQLIVYRAIQAIGGSGMMVIAFAIVRDVYSGEKSAKVYSFLNGIISFSPMFAPFVGSYLDLHFNWPMTFLCLLLVALFAFLSIGFGQKESLAKDKRIRITSSIFREYRLILMNRVFLPYNLMTAMGLSYLYLFCSISPYIIIRLLHLSEAHYGFYFAFMGVSVLIGSFLCGVLVERLGVFYTVLLGIILSLTGGLIMLIWFYITGLTINNFIWPMLLIGVGGSFSLGAGTGGSMEPFGDNAGAAAALGGSIRFIFAALIGSIVVHSNLSSTLPLAGPTIVFSLFGLVLLFVCRKRLHFRRYGCQAAKI